MNKNEHGLTLIEVLLTLSLLSVVSLLIWGVFFQGAKYTATAVSTNQMQQEANQMATNLTRIHQTAEWYEIATNDGTVTIINKNAKKEDENINIYESNQFDYEVKITEPTRINPNKRNVEATIIVADKQDDTNKVEIDTYLSRLQNTGAEQEGE